MIQILVVEDDPGLNHSVCKYLADCGYEAKGCLHPEKAYDLMYMQSFDMIISDIMMCSLDAIDATHFGLARGCYLKKFIYEKKPAGHSFRRPCWLL